MTQNEALELLMMGHNVYLTGQAGSGKTYLLNEYVKFLKKNKVGVAITASTGIAATHLNGITIHSWSGIGIKKEMTDSEISKLNANVQKRQKIQTPKVLIIDEISMLHSYRLDTINKICKVIRRNQQPFGGLQVILCGDFFQLPPITDEGYAPSSFAYKSDAWRELDLKICYLDEQHRQWDEEFLQILNDIRTSEVDEGTFERLTKRINGDLPKGANPTKLYSHNADVDAINNFQLKKIDKKEFTYQMQATGKKELIEALKKGCLAPEELVLKEGAAVMFIKNNPSKGYINGTLGKVIGFDSDKYPIVQLHSGEEIVAQPASWIVEEMEDTLAEISQIPLRLAWAITVHKSQGMSLDFAEIDLSKSFAFGMGYVALSRLRSLEGLRLLGINQMAFRVNGEIGEIDIQFKKLSKEAAEELRQMDKKSLKAIQDKYLSKIIPKEFEVKGEDTVKALFNKVFSKNQRC
ncbi:MAG TPA: PIF1 family ATP-dependent DNA helicase [Candidatus Saccharimonadales bacterium]|nr:PIF1 family ATP-dependent DNA helicase [Candidatus Saccharimonadales bacterium]